VLMATVAAIIASQALISGSFTIFSEAMSLNFWPRQRIKYPTEVKGQLYIPFVNWFLYAFCVVMVLFFQTSSNMEAAYGLSITITMLMTTLLLASYLKAKFKLALVIPFIAFFLTLEFLFLLSNMFKFMPGLLKINMFNF
jgi:KUP system potassium uptake protein